MNIHIHGFRVRMNYTGLKLNEVVESVTSDSEKEDNEPLERYFKSRPPPPEFWVQVAEPLNPGLNQCLSGEVHLI